uniref:Ovule protein n=1 Tax=Mesocestoides corti TaxID=53468 RepID=A0A5K3G014_MESCO
KGNSVEYPTSIIQKTSATEQALLTNQNPEPHVRRLPSESTMLATPPIIYCSSFMSSCGWLVILLTCRWNAEKHRSQSHASGAFHPNPPRWPRRSLYTASHPCPSLVDCLPFPHAIGSQRDTGLAEARWSNMSAP